VCPSHLEERTLKKERSRKDKRGENISGEKDDKKLESWRREDTRTL
jgi:hypothetical protein